MQKSKEEDEQQHKFARGWMNESDKNIEREINVGREKSKECEGKKESQDFVPRI